MVDSTSSELDMRMWLKSAIREFGGWVSRSNWTAAGKAHASQYGSHTESLAYGREGSTVTFHADGVEWRFNSYVLSDTYVLVVREGGASWDMLYDQYGSGEQHAVLYNDEASEIRGVSNARLWAISCNFVSIMEQFLEHELGAIPYALHQPKPKPATSTGVDYRWVLAGVGGGLLILLCISCLIGNYILASG